LQVVANCHLYI